MGNFGSNVESGSWQFSAAWSGRSYTCIFGNKTKGLAHIYAAGNNQGHNQRHHPNSTLAIPRVRYQSGVMFHDLDESAADTDPFNVSLQASVTWPDGLPSLWWRRSQTLTTRNVKRVVAYHPAGSRTQASIISAGPETPRYLEVGFKSHLSTPPRRATSDCLPEATSIWHPPSQPAQPGSESPAPRYGR